MNNALICHKFDFNIKWALLDCQGETHNVYWAFVRVIKTTRENFFLIYQRSFSP